VVPSPCQWGEANARDVAGLRDLVAGLDHGSRTHCEFRRRALALLVRVRDPPGRPAVRDLGPVTISSGRACDDEQVVQNLRAWVQLVQAEI
jgi:hypothetical protein